MWIVGMDQVLGDLPYKLTRGSHVIGRSRTCDVVIRHQTLSRQHARIWRSDKDQVTIKDLESKNGTFVGEMRIQQHPLKPQTIFRLGEIRLSLQLTAPDDFMEMSEATYSAKGEPKATPARPLIENLTPAQKQVLDFIAEGFNEEEIAERLKRSMSTIHHHLQAIFTKLGVHTRADLLALLIRSQHIDQPGRSGRRK